LSQVSIIDIEGNHPQIPTQFNGNVGFAVPIGNQLNILGAVVAAGSNPVRTVAAGNTVTTQVQISQAIASTNAANIGLSAFNSTEFSVDANGFVSLLSAPTPTLSIQTNVGGPVSPTSGGVLSILGSITTPSGAPLRSNGTVANTVSLIAQTSSAQVASSINNAGMSSFDNTKFTVDTNGFVTTLGTAIPNTITGQSGGALSPTAGNWNIFGASTAAGTSPVNTSGAVSTLTVNVQKSQAIAATDATKVGLANFDSAKFTVDANGFVSTSGTGIGQTITGDSGGALSPTAGNWNILGGPGVTTSGSGSTLTINSVVFTDQGSSTTVASDNGYFVTGNFAMTLPAAPSQGEMVIIYADTTSTVTITANAGQVIRLGTNVTAAAGSITSGARGDSLTLRYRSSGTEWNGVDATGGWIF
jgi:hypothetical protein